jgi:hypothetical protein
MGKRYLPEYSHAGFAGLWFTMYPDISTSSVQGVSRNEKTVPANDRVSRLPQRVASIR